MGDRTGDSARKGSPTTADSLASDAPRGRPAGLLGEIKAVLNNVAIYFGRKPPKPTLPEGTADKSTSLAQERTGMALDRSYLAVERTLMAWIRTSLSMISFGFTIGKLSDVLKDVIITGPLGRSSQVDIDRIAYFLVTLGTTALFGAGLQYVHRVGELMRRGLHRGVSLVFVVAMLLVLVGVFALGSLVSAL